jgi:hypothetical protein
MTTDNGQFIKRASPVKCDKCSKETTFVHPRRFCDHHWCEWWSKIGRTPEEKKQIYKEAMDLIKKLSFKEMVEGDCE